MNSLAAFAALLAYAAAAAAQAGPQTVVRQFCEADAAGRRGTIQGWSRLAPLVEWSLEPAWDRAALITSYTVGWPVAAANDSMVVEVRYAVTREVTANEIKDAPRIETVSFKVRATEGTQWKIIGPPPPPFIFEQQVDAAALRLSLERGGMNFISNSMFVWQMMRSAGWNVPYVRTDELLGTDAYRTVRQAKGGDLLVYLRQGTPYHVALIESPDSVVSSTINGGIVRTTPDAFPGESKLLRLVRPRAATPSDDEPSEDEPASAIAPALVPATTTPTSVRVASPTAKPTALPRKQRRGRSR